MSSNLKVQRICQHCGIEFTARTTVTQYCGDTCASRAYKVRLRASKVDETNKQTRRIKNQPIEELKAKAFLSIAETCKLIGISRRTVYRLIERGELITGKAGKRTIIRRSDLERLIFEDSKPVTPQTTKEAKQLQFDISECYTLSEAQSKFGISQTGLQILIKRFEVPKLKVGRFAYIPKTIIDRILL